MQGGEVGCGVRDSGAGAVADCFFPDRSAYLSTVVPTGVVILLEASTVQSSPTSRHPLRKP
jgi:hypothetical protein